MIPLAIDPRLARLAVAGGGAPALRRLRALRRGGAAASLLFAPAPDEELRREAGPHWRETLPDDAALAGLHILWITGLAPAAAAGLAARARAARVLVNVEDRPEFCDFHSVAEVRRGDLLLTVSTNGKAPGVAGAIRRNLETCFPAAWDARLDEVADLRAGWRASGLPMEETARRTRALLAERCWLNCPRPN